MEKRLFHYTVIISVKSEHIFLSCAKYVVTLHKF